MAAKYTSDTECHIRIGDWPVKKGDIIDGPKDTIDRLLAMAGFEHVDPPNAKGIPHQGFVFWVHQDERADTAEKKE